jgi:K+-sensing histidine kinase KdpD
VPPGLFVPCESVFFKEPRSKESTISIFPTKILLATDGSEEAVRAAKTAADLANKTDSELHIVHVRPRIKPH